MVQGAGAIRAGRAGREHRAQEEGAVFLARAWWLQIQTHARGPAVRPSLPVLLAAGVALILRPPRPLGPAGLFHLVVLLLCHASWVDDGRRCVEAGK